MFISRVGGIIYVFKYILNERDRVEVYMIGENQRYDEISNHLDTRYAYESK